MKKYKTKNEVLLTKFFLESNALIRKDPQIIYNWYSVLTEMLSFSISQKKRVGKHVRKFVCKLLHRFRQTFHI